MTPTARLPSSEPETTAVRAFMSSRQVTTMITNHNDSNLVLRTPSLASTGFSPDEPPVPRTRCGIRRAQRLRKYPVVRAL